VKLVGLSMFMVGTKTISENGIVKQRIFLDFKY
jgi:hypothetical protein